MQSNRFKAFSDSDNEHSEEDQSQKQNRQVDNRPRAEKRKFQTKKQEEVEEVQKQQDKKQKSAKEGPKQKGVSAEPHPLDKHSGSGLRTHDRKGGAGSRNWGTFKDDVKENYVTKEEGQQEIEEVIEEKQEEEQLTLNEYLAKNGGQKTQNIQKQNKGNQDYTEFVKEGCQVIEKTAEVDDKNPTKQKKTNDNYIAMQNTDLLGFRTGLKTYALKERVDKNDNDFKKERQPRENKEQQQEQKKTETPLVQGDQLEIKQEEQVEQNIENDKKQTRNYNNNRNYEKRPYNRGEGGQYKGQKSGGRQQQTQKTSIKVNFEDDSLFPKLG